MPLARRAARTQRRVTGGNSGNGPNEGIAVEGLSRWQWTVWEQRPADGANETVRVGDGAPSAEAGPAGARQRGAWARRGREEATREGPRR